MPSSDNYRFSRIQNEDINKIGGHWAAVQDAYGFIWFGGSGGLGRYDGVELKVYRNHPNDKNSLSNNYVTDLLVDDDGLLWVATRSGLNRYEYSTDSFEHYFHDADDPRSISHNYVWALLLGKNNGIWVGTGAGVGRFDPVQKKFEPLSVKSTTGPNLSGIGVIALAEGKNNRLWIGTEKHGVGLYNPQTQDLTYLGHRTDQLNSLSDNYVTTFYEDDQGRMWVGTLNGVNLYLGGEAFRRFTSSAVRHPLNGNSVRAILQDATGKMWVGTDDGGLSIYDKEGSRFKTIDADDALDNGIVNNKIRSIFKDSGGNLWFGHFPAGVSLLDSYASAFHNYQHVKFDSNSLSNSDILAIAETPSGDLWVGTEFGLNYINRSNGVITRHIHDGSNKKGLPANAVVSLLVDSAGVLWVGTWGGGLSRYNSARNVFEYFPGLSATQARVIYETQDNRFLWIGTENGASRMDRETNTFTHYANTKDRPQSLSPLGVNFITEDKKGGLWLGGDTALNKYEVESDSFLRYENSSDKKNSLGAGYITQIFEDSLGRLWIAMGSEGVRVLDLRTMQFSSLRAGQEIVDDIVGGIVEDALGNIWISGGSGVGQYDPQSKRIIRQFTKDHGLPGNLFKRPAVIKTLKNELIFGSTQGLTIFDPQKIPSNKQVPPVVISDFEIFYMPVSVGKGAAIEENILTAKKVVLNYKQTVFSFRFNALNYLLTHRNQYQYMLEGFDKAWVTGGSRNIANYTNLNAGKYIFRVRGSNDEGVWNNQGDSVAITILPAPWRTWWAYCLYVIFFVALLVWFVVVQRQKVFYEREKLRQKSELVSRLEELDKIKDNVLANTSHELRTPLYGIIGMAEMMLAGLDKSLPDAMRGNLEIISASGQRLSRLVEDILDFSNFKASKLQLRTEPVNLAVVVDTVIKVTSFDTKRKNLELMNDVDSDSPLVLADVDRLHQILFNLVNNAIKFTEVGFVSVSASEQGEKLLVSVADSGVGIAEEYKESIFESFEQVEDSDNRCFGGIGLGLSITKRLVELHGGEMSLATQVGAGSCFSFSLPLAPVNSVPVNLESLQSNVGVHEPITKPRGDIASGGDYIGAKNVQAGSEGRPRILIVDDDPANRHLLLNQLGEADFNLSTAMDGVEAIEFVKNKLVFDLILLDIMMPQLSGYDVCEAIRRTYPAQELPILFITAKNMPTDIKRGYSVGGNDFIQKPVSKEELISRVNLHLQLLNINKLMEQKIAERTQSLHEEHEKLKDTQAQLVQSEKVAGLVTLVSGIAHEFKNPINYSYSATYNLEKEVNRILKFYEKSIKSELDDEDGRLFEGMVQASFGQLSLISDGSKRVMQLVDDLMAYSSGDRNSIEIMALNKSFNTTINLLKNNAKAHIEFRLESQDDAYISAHVAAINQAFYNVVANAAQAVEAKAREQKHYYGLIAIDISLTGTFVEIKISDNGIGMTPDTLQKAFDPFYTTKPPGSGVGLGLALAYRAVEEDGGTINIQSELGEGTVVTVKFPRLP